MPTSERGKEEKMGLFDKLRKKNETITVNAEKGTLYLPVEGEVIPLKEIEDNVFSEGILGDGFGVRPSGETVYAPANGTVTTLVDSNHAVGMMSDDGMEILIHVGMDTVNMQGDGFQILVKQDQKVKCGQELLRFDQAKIKAAGHPTTTAVVLTNSSEFSKISLLSTGQMEKLTPVLKAEK